MSSLQNSSSAEKHKGHRRYNLIQPVCKINLEDTNSFLTVEVGRRLRWSRVWNHRKDTRRQERCPTSLRHRYTAGKHSFCFTSTHVRQLVTRACVILTKQYWGSKNFDPTIAKMYWSASSAIQLSRHTSSSSTINKTDQSMLICWRRHRVPVVHPVVGGTQRRSGNWRRIPSFMVQSLWSCPGNVPPLQIL